MYELKIKVEAPGLEQAINHLADALTGGTCAGKCAQQPVEAPTAAAPAPQGINTPAQVNAPVQPATAPAQGVQPVTPSPAPVPPAAPAPVPAPVQTPPPPAVTAPVQAPPPAPAQVPAGQATQPSGVTLEAIINAGAGLVERGMMAQVVALLGKYGLQAVNQLQPAQYEPFAAELRTLGATI